VTRSFTRTVQVVHLEPPTRSLAAEERDDRFGSLIAAGSQVGAVPGAFEYHEPRARRYLLFAPRPLDGGRQIIRT
jgi:hypothetical protein